MPRKPAVEKAAAQPTRPKIERRAKTDASARIGGKLQPFQAVPATPRKLVKRSAPKKEARKVRDKLLKATSYKTMVKKAILDDQSRKGTSLAAIANYIQANYEVKENFRRYLRLSLARQVEAGLLEKKSPARYALTTKAKTTPKKKKKTTKAKPEKKEGKTGRTSSTPTKGTPKKAPTKKTATRASKASSKGVAKEGAPKKTRGATKVKATPTKSTRGKASSARGAGSSETSDSGKLIWVWQYYDNGFFNYDPAACDVVEGVYQEYLTSPFTCDVRAVKSGQWEYEIDFRVMTQRNIKHASHTTRKIRRYQIPESEKDDTHKCYPGTPDTQQESD